MKPITPYPGHRYKRRFAAALFTIAASTITHAGPGAHGPNGEHLDSPAAGSAQGGSSPRVEAKSETFELVGRFEGGALTLFIDKFATNEPVLSANVEVEAGNIRARAQFRAEQGDYIVTDPAMLKLLAGPTRQAMVFTISAGADSDLLDGPLMPASGVAGPDAAHDHVGGNGWRYASVVIALVVAAGAFVFWRRRQTGRSSRAPSGAGK